MITNIKLITIILIYLINIILTGNPDNCTLNYMKNINNCEYDSNCCILNIKLSNTSLCITTNRLNEYKSLYPKNVSDTFYGCGLEETIDLTKETTPKKQFYKCFNYGNNYSSCVQMEDCCWLYSKNNIDKGKCFSKSKGKIADDLPGLKCDSSNYFNIKYSFLILFLLL